MKHDNVIGFIGLVGLAAVNVLFLTGYCYNTRDRVVWAFLFVWLSAINYIVVKMMTNKSKRDERSLRDKVITINQKHSARRWWCQADECKCNSAECMPDELLQAFAALGQANSIVTMWDSFLGPAKTLVAVLVISSILAILIK